MNYCRPNTDIPAKCYVEILDYTCICICLNILYFVMPNFELGPTVFLTYNRPIVTFLSIVFIHSLTSKLGICLYFYIKILFALHL